MSMPDADRRQFLAELHVGVLAVADGERSLAVPIWYRYDPDVGVSVITGGGSRKARAVRGARRFSLTVQTEAVPYRYVSVEGALVEDRPAEIERDLRPMAVRYLGDEAGNRYAEAWRTFGVEDVVLVMRPDEWLSHDTTGEFEQLGITAAGGAASGAAGSLESRPRAATQH
jgi:nitroimidazol reductase NimA-like FMN-containing flavoprotein (pyridoxamine 5'-phosphate oxidase superfamily)